MPNFKIFNTIKFNYKKPPFILNPTIIKLGLVSFFTDIASEMLYPITPIFLTTVLGASMTHLGFIEGFAEAFANIIKTYCGAWSDQIYRRKPFILAGYTLSAISKPLMGISHTWGSLLSARALDRAGKGIRTAPRDALIADSVDKKNYGLAFGWHRSMDTLGAVLGPLLSLLLLSYFDDLRKLYYWTLLPGIISIYLVFFINEPTHQSLKNDRKIASPHIQSYRWNPSNSVIKYFFAWGVFSLTNSSDVFLLMKARSLGMTTSAILLLYCSYNLIYALSSPLLGGLSDRWGKKQTLLTGFTIFSSVYLGFAYAQHTWQIIILFFIYGLYMGATDGVGKALTIDLTPVEFKATSIGLLSTITGVCGLFASLVAGILWDHLGPQWTFYYGCIGGIFSASILLKINLQPHNSNSR